MTSAAESFETLLQQSEAFEAALQDCFPEGTLLLADSSPKHELAATAARLGIEHAAALRASFAVGAPSSAAALLRLQYEAVLRSAWLLYAAPAGQVEKLHRPLDLEAEQASKNMTGYADMLAAIVRAAPLGLSKPLSEFNQYSRQALNSFVHAGIHPLARMRAGFPVALAMRLLQFSNAMSHFAYRLLATLTGSQRRMDKVTHAYEAFEPCLPFVQEEQPSGDAAGGSA